MFKAANIIMAYNGNPQQHRASIKGDKFEYIIIAIPLLDFNLAARVCKELVEKEGVQGINLCPGFTHEAVAKVRSAIGDSVAITVARGDIPSTIITNQILTKEGWIPGSC